MRTGLQDDLEYTYIQLLKHPLLALDRQKRLQFEELYKRKKSLEMDEAALVDALTSLTVFFGDGHTNMELPYTGEDRCLNFPCRWSEHDGDVLLLDSRYGDIEEGTEILTVEDLPMTALITLLSEKIPHENRYLVKSRMIHYPYKNYHLFSQMNLSALFGIKKSYRISFSANGRIVERECPLSAYNGFLEFRQGRECLSYALFSDTAVLHLNACICDETYKETLQFLAHACRRRGIRSFILDLSKNMGGSSAVIDEFIRYVSIKEFRRYGMIEYSSGVPQRKSDRREIVQNPRQEICLPERLYCRVSHDTFSSAKSFAVTLKDNGLATVIGTATGGKPTSFGLPRRYRTPLASISFRVSTSLFLRPDAEQDEEISLFPDVALPELFK